MSYCILYRSMFVRLSDGRYIPMIEAGDNNVWETNKRRAREWQHATIGGNKIVMTADEIMSSIEDEINSYKSEFLGKVIPDYKGGDGVATYTDKGLEETYGYEKGVSIYGKHTYSTTAQQIRNFFKGGIKRAIPFEEIRLRVWWNTDEPFRYEYRYPKTEDELFAAIKEGQDTGRSVWVDYSSPYEVSRAWDKIKRANKIQRKTIEHTKGFVVTCDYRYLKKATKRNFQVTSYIEYAHVYPARANAEKMNKRILKSYPSEIIEVKKTDGKWQRTA